MVGSGNIPVSAFTTARLPPVSRMSRGLGLLIGADGAVTVKSADLAGQRLRISSDGLAISVEERPAPFKTVTHVFSLRTLPRKYHELYMAGSRFVALVRSLTPRVHLQLGHVRACLMESGVDFVVTLSRSDGAARCHFTPSGCSATFVEESGCECSVPISCNPASVHRLSPERARMLCLTLFLWQECVRVERSFKDFPVRLGGASLGLGPDLSVTAFVAKPGVGWALRVQEKILFFLLPDFSSVAISRRGRERRLSVLFSLPDGRQHEVEVKGRLPVAFRIRLGALLILLRAVTAPAAVNF